MNVSKIMRYAIPTVLGCIMAPAIASAQVAGPNICEGPTGPGTGLITLPSDLCCYNTMIPDNLARRVIQRDDFGQILLYMSEACPELALALNDFATAAVTETNGEVDSGPTHCEFAATACNPTPPPEVEPPEDETEDETEAEGETEGETEGDSDRVQVISVTLPDDN